MNQHFLTAVRALHRAKTASYRDAWRKRGEVLSILANIARKVDRLAYIADGAPTGQSETLIDTAVDLLVYCLKYETFLADLDTAVATSLFAGTDVTPPYSTGVSGFEELLARMDGRVSNNPVKHEIHNVMDAFSSVEAAFSGVAVISPIELRAQLAHHLSGCALRLVTALWQEYPDAVDDFIQRVSQESMAL